MSENEGKKVGAGDWLGEASGVKVVEMNAGAHSGYVVTFPFDRQLGRMLKNAVPAAAFDETTKTFNVPGSSGDALAQVVAAMRRELRAIETDRTDIESLAMASGRQAQHANRKGLDVEPKVSGYAQPGKSYRGFVVNANARFIAQETGFGKEDGAAFLHIHRLADLDNSRLMKGARVGIVYDAKFQGVVTDLSKHKSAADLSAEFKASNGKAIDGVVASDLGDRIGVAFDFNVAMAERIRRVEGAAFNKEGRVWEIPKDKQEFALYAVQDVRAEFVADAKEVAELREVGESLIDGATVKEPFIKDGTQYFGEVVAVSERYAMQNVGRGGFALHRLAALDVAPERNHEVEIKYDKGVGAVLDKTQQRAMSSGVGR